MLKKALSIILVLIITVTAVPLVGLTGVFAATSDVFTYEINYNNTAIEITDCSASASGALTIPATIEGLPVTSIGSYAFYGCSSLTSVTIPNSVTNIGDYAFSGCSSLTSVTISNIVTNIGSYAFFSCSSLTSITIPNSVTRIGSRAFSCCSSLTSITIPNSVTSIGNGALYGTAYYNNASNWQNGVLYVGNYLIVADSGVLSGSYTIKVGTLCIADYAFSGCSSLTSVTIPDSVTSIADGAFFDCSSLTSVTIPNSVTNIGNWALYGCSSLTNVTIPNSVTSIADGAFSDCSSFTSVTIPNSVTNIGNCAFENCSSLTSVTIPNSVTNIGDYAFYCCSSLTSVTIPNSVTSIGNGAFYGTAYYNNASNWQSGVLYVGNYLIVADSGVLSGSYTIKTGTLCIANWAFSGCSSLTSVTIPNSVTSISNGAFSDCSSLTSVTIPNSVTSTGNYAFYRCSSLTSVTIPNSVTNIGDYAFSGCSSLTSVTIPNSITSIGICAYCDCNKILTVTIPSSVKSIGDYALGYSYGYNKSSYGIIPLNTLTPPGKVDGFTICCYANTAGHNYAISNGIKYTILNDSPSLAGISVKTNPTKTNYYAGDTLNTAGLTLTATYSNGTTQIISSGFTCSPTILSTVGTKIITVTYNGKTTTFNVTVTAAVKVTGIKLNAATASVTLGGTKQLTATVSPSNATNKAVTWSSSNTGVAMVSSSGLVTAKAVGKATITCKAKDGSGKTATCTVTVIPKTPTGVKAASASYNSIKITWTAVSGATGYAVYRAASKTGTYSCLKTTTATSFTDTSRPTGTTYYYKVRAYKTVSDKKYYSGYSAIVSAKAATPTPVSVKAASASYNSIKITWTAVSGVTGYAVYRATSKTGTYSCLKATTSTSFTDTSRTTGTTYYYKVKAYKTVGDKKYYSGYSAVVSAKAVPSVPGSFTAAKASSTSVKTSWKAVSGATGYEVWMATSSTGTYTKIKTTTSLSFTKTGLTKGKTYYFKARTYKTVNGTKVYGAFTSVKSAKPS